MSAAPPTPGVRTRRAAAAEAAAAAASAAASASAPARHGGVGRARTSSGGAGGPFLWPAPPPARLVLRTLVLAWLAVVWLWHLTPAAKVLPGATGYLWFCRYLTFYSFSLQLLATSLAVAHEARAHYFCSPAAGKTSGPPKRRAAPLPPPPKNDPQAAALARWADDLGCAVFCFAHVVTLMFHIIQAATGGKAVEGAHIDRPPWLDASVHRLNAAAAWLDVAALSPRGGRSFSRSGERLSVALVALYCATLASSKFLNGSFPYPFMNAMGQPHGFLVVCGGGVLIFGGAFKLGRLIGGGLRRAEDYYLGAAAAAVEEAEEAVREAKEQRRRRREEEEEEEQEEQQQGKTKGRGGVGGGGGVRARLLSLLRRRRPSK